MSLPRRCRRPLVTLLAALCVAAVVAEAAGADREAERRLVNDRCPVMQDEPASPVYEVQFRGVAVRFCCSDCREKFTYNPSRYLSRLPQLPVGSLDANEYAGAEQAAGWLDRWTPPVLVVLVGLTTGFLVVRIVRRVRHAHAAGALSPLAPEEEFRPATGPHASD